MTAILWEAKNAYNLRGKQNDTRKKNPARNRAHGKMIVNMKRAAFYLTRRVIKRKINIDQTLKNGRQEQHLMMFCAPSR